MSAVAELEAAGGEVSLTGTFGTWAREISYWADQEATSDDKGLRSRLMAQDFIRPSTPEWHFCWALSEALDAGEGVTRQPELRSKIGALGGQRGRAPLWRWYWRMVDGLIPES